jgi:putative FmdB family regulatory protein
MPIYSYICKDCGEKFDLFIRSGGKGEKLICKKCGSKNIQKTFSSFSMGSSSSKDSGYDSSCPTGTCRLD